nr:sigma factor-like helix-turn-helix DNA-binding protein [Legionella londiniensis]
MRKIQETLRQHYELNRSNREIGRSLNISPGTVSNYLYRARMAGITWPAALKMEELNYMSGYLCLRNNLHKNGHCRIGNRYIQSFARKA